MVAAFFLVVGRVRPLDFSTPASASFTTVNASHNSMRSAAFRFAAGGLSLLVISIALALAAVMVCGAAGREETGLPFQWGGGSSPNMASTAKRLPADPGSVAPLWELTLGSHTYSIPTIDRGRIYLGANDTGVRRTGYKPTGGGVLMCVEQATGRLIWQLPSPRYFAGVKPPYHFDQWNCGICSGPVVDGDRVYVIGSRGEILCLDREGQANGNDGPFQDELAYMGITNAPGAKLEPTDGDIIWKYDLIPELDVVLHDACGSTLLVHGDLLYACTSNGIDDRHEKVPKPDAPSLIVLDKRTGRLVARDDEKIGRRLLHCNWSSPSPGRVNGRTLIFFGGGDGILYAFEPPAPRPDSQVRILHKVWSYDCNPPDFRVRDGQPVPYSKSSKNRPDGPSEIIGTPVLYQGRVYVAIGQTPFTATDAAASLALMPAPEPKSGPQNWSSDPWRHHRWPRVSSTSRIPLAISTVLTPAPASDIGSTLWAPQPAMLRPSWPMTRCTSARKPELFGS